jgi:hypothetical protein
MKDKHQEPLSPQKSGPKSGPQAGRGATRDARSAQQHAAGRQPPGGRAHEQPVWQPTVWQPIVSRLVQRLPPAWRRRRRWAGVGAALLGILVIYFATRPASAPTPQQVAPDTRVFSVSGRPALVFAHTVGSVHLVPGTNGQVRVQETRNGITDSIAVHYAQRGNVITVTVDIPTGLYLDTWVDFNVAVPKHAGVEVRTATGTLTASGLSGQVALNDTDGSIWATGLTGSATLQSLSGSINTDGVSGQLVATTGNGTITTTATHLSGRCSLQAQSGTINFHGSLDRKGSFAFRNSNGAIGLTLPPDAAFQLNARSSGGSVNTSFRGVIASHASGGVLARGNVGSSPRPQLSIQTNSGSIDVEPGV